MKEELKEYLDDQPQLNEVLELWNKPLSAFNGILYKYQIEQKIKKPKLKNKYIRFEIETGDFPFCNFTSHRLMGIFYRQDKNGSIKEVKEYVLSTGSSANNPLLELLMPIFNSIAFENLSVFLKDKSKYFEN